VVMSPIDNLLSRLDRVNKVSGGWRSRCPSHQSKSLSLAISEVDDGRVLLKCFAGCEALAILQSIGLTLSDLFPNDTKHTPAQKHQYRINKSAHETLKAIEDPVNVLMIGTCMAIRGELTEMQEFEVYEAYHTIQRALIAAGIPTINKGLHHGG